jgi:HEAT repeat protein
MQLKSIRGMFAIAFSIVLIGTAAMAADVAGLVGKLKSDNSNEVRSAAKELGDMGGGAADAIGPLFDVLGEGDAKTKVEAAKALRSIGSGDKAALVEQLIGERDLMGKLRELSEGDNPLVKKAVDGLASDSVGALKNRLGSTDDPGIQRGVIDALGNAGPLAESAVPELEGLAKDSQDAGVRNAAGKALSKIRG